MLSLLRKSLWNTPVDLSLFSGPDVDWDAIAKMAMKQTVGMLVLEAVRSLPEKILPPEDWRLKAAVVLERNRRTHVLIDSCVAEAVTNLKAQGIGSVLLKGQAYALAYPRPVLRQCGDIDLYVGEQNYRRAYQAATVLGWECENDFRPDAKHYISLLHGMPVELHRTAAILASPEANRKFQKWSVYVLTLDKSDIEICGEKITVPTPLFSVIFVFLHLYHHFLFGGIGLRQVCDWTMLLHKYHNEIDVVKLEKLLKDFGLLKGWKLFTPIAVRLLGLPESECPFYSDTNPKLSDKILSHILTGGNFGRAAHQASNRPEGYLAGKFHSLKRHSAKLKEMFMIDPLSISLIYANILFKGTRRVLIDLLKAVSPRHTTR